MKTSKTYPKREEFQWRPAPLLCKRFDLPDPFMGKVNKWFLASPSGMSFRLENELSYNVLLWNADLLVKILHNHELSCIKCNLM